jgi:hypothetical protein
MSISKLSAIVRQHADKFPFASSRENAFLFFVLDLVAKSPRADAARLTWGISLGWGADSELGHFLLQALAVRS